MIEKHGTHRFERAGARCCVCSFVRAKPFHCARAIVCSFIGAAAAGEFSRHSLPCRWDRALSAIALYVAAAFACAASAAGVGEGPRENLAVKRVDVYGNRVTQERMILRCLSIDRGTVYDSARIVAAKNRLEETGLFSDVAVFPFRENDSLLLRVIVVERPYFSISDIGGELRNPYGTRPREWWRRGRVRLGLRLDNFRGMMESVGMSITLLEWRIVRFSWYKPLPGSGYWIAAATGAADVPSVTDSLRTRSLWARLVGGRRVGSDSRVYVFGLPHYKNARLLDFGIEEPDTLFAASDTSSERFVVDTVQRHSEERTFLEARVGAGWFMDHRDRSFDPRRGWSLRVEATVNPVYPDGRAVRTNPMFRRRAEYNERERSILREHGRTFTSADSVQILSAQYFQLAAQARYYLPGFFDRDRFACRVKGSVRTTEGGLLHRIYAGGEQTVRGYADGAVSSGNRANNLAGFSAEYRFPIWKSPAIDLFDLSRVGYDLNDFHYRLDGGLFFDAGHVWDTWSGPLKEGGYETVYSCGAGLRVMFPTLNRSGAWDVVPLARNLITGEPEWAWRWHLYVDLRY